jgi:hypothetical protein
LGGSGLACASKRRIAFCTSGFVLRRECRCWRLHPRMSVAQRKLIRMLRDRTVSSRYTVAAWVLTGVALVLVLQLHVLPALLAGMLVYQLVHVIAPTMNKHLSDKRAKLIAVGLLSALVVIFVNAAIIGAIVFFRSDA